MNEANHESASCHDLVGVAVRVGGRGTGLCRDWPDPDPTRPRTASSPAMFSSLTTVGGCTRKTISRSRAKATSRSASRYGWKVRNSGMTLPPANLAWCSIIVQPRKQLPRTERSTRHSRRRGEATMFLLPGRVPALRSRRLLASSNPPIDQRGYCLAPPQASPSSTGWLHPASSTGSALSTWQRTA